MMHNVSNIGLLKLNESVMSGESNGKSAAKSKGPAHSIKTYHKEPVKKPHNFFQLTSDDKNMIKRRNSAS